MLKKIGIVAATATAGLLALSPLAFASGNGGHGHHDDDEVTNIWIYDDSVERDQINRCESEQELDVPDAAGPITVTQTQTDNCVNAGDDTELPEPAPLPLPLPLVG